MQRKEQIGITRDDAFKTVMEYTHWRANPRLVRAFVNKSASTIEWLQGLGVEFTEPFAMWPGSPRTWHLIKGEGAALIKVLAARASTLDQRRTLSLNKVPGARASRRGEIHGSPIQSCLRFIDEGARQ